MTRTVLCSAGRGELAVEACLSCALESPNKHSDCGMDYGLLKGLINNHQERPDIHVTDLTGCLKKAYLSKTSQKPTYVHLALPLMLGVATHGHLEDSDHHIACELPLELNGIKGTADIVYNGGEGRIVDWKTTRWLNSGRLPYGSHTLQVNIYAHMLRRSGRQVKSLAIQYIDMSGPTKCRKCRQTVQPNAFGELACPKCGSTPAGAHLGAILVEVPLMSEREIGELVERRRKTLQDALDHHIPPGAEPSWLCSYCLFAENCSEAEL